LADLYDFRYELRCDVVDSFVDSLLTLHTFKPESVAPNREPERIHPEVGLPYVKRREDLLNLVRTNLNEVKVLLTKK